MRLYAFASMASDYGTLALDEWDAESRSEALATHPHPVLAEGGHCEFDGLLQWVGQQFPPEEYLQLTYGKTNYNFGFAEFFFRSAEAAAQCAAAIPSMYVAYPWSQQPGLPRKSLGDEVEVTTSPDDATAIIFRPSINWPLP